MIGAIAVLVFFVLDLALVTGALLWLSRRRLEAERKPRRRNLPGWD